MEHSDKSENAEKKVAPSSFSNRSASLDSSFSSSSDEVAYKSLHYSLYNTPVFQSGGAFKSLYRSPFGSVVSAGISLKGKVRKLISIFDSPKDPSITPNSQPTPSKPPNLLLTASNSSDYIPKSLSSLVADFPFRLPGTEDRVVIYFTSLRGIRRTFTDCQNIRLIFRGLRVKLDERDVSMDISYRKQLQRVLGEINICLPQVFIKGKYVGGADVTRQLLEAGELVRLINGLPLQPEKPCDGCNDIRFILCTHCNGSRRASDDNDEQPKRCAMCNENGLERCPLCSA